MQTRKSRSTKAAPRTRSLLPVLPVLPPTAGPMPGPAPDPADGPPCHLCTGLCCKYFALEIDKPTTPRDYEDIRWYLLHENIAVWVEDDDWFLEVKTRCKELLADNRCAIYDTRPDICREYGLPENADDGEEPCEYFTQGEKYDLYFDDAEAFAAFAKKELTKRERRLARRRQLYRERARERIA